LRRGLLLRVSAMAVMTSLVTAQAMSDEIVISDDGRQIQLNSDGSWVQLSRDRYATNAAGERVRLRPDGRWGVLAQDQDQGQNQADASSSAQTPMIAAGESVLFLAKVEILKRRIKRAKSVHAQTNTVYHLQIRNDSSEVIELGDDLAASLTARSSSGRVYTIESVSYDDDIIEPGEQAGVRVVAAGSPTWFGVKFLSLEIAAGALGNAQKRVLSKNMNDIKKVSVDKL